jgi:HAMP domain-containing protein
MTARRLTAALAALFIAICAWMYLRDVGGATPSAPERVRAQAAAGMALRLVTPPGSCSSGCAADVIDEQGAGLWRVRLQTRAWRRCFVLRLSAFAFSSDHGVTGLRTTGCP